MTTNLQPAGAGAEAGTVLAELLRLRADVETEGAAELAAWSSRIHRPEFEASAANLAHYLAFRRRDLRELQEALMPLGLSSLGRCEGRVLASLDAVIALLSAALGARGPVRSGDRERFAGGALLLERNTAVAFGPPAASRRVRIMVTLPAEAAGDREIVRGLVAFGMDAARINCAHGTHDEWRAITAAVHEEAAAQGRTCRICMDLCGPRARTGEVTGPRAADRLVAGDALLLAGEPGPAAAPAGSRAALLEAGALVRAGCSLPEILPQLAPGMRVFVNEGKLGTVVEAVAPGAVLLRVQHTAPGGTRIRPDKGLNFPDTELELDPLTPKDIADLDVVAELADVVGYSFVQRPEDIARLRTELDARTPRSRELVLMAKIETPLALRNLPELIVEAAGSQPFAVMIARGDLAVELGYQRLAEVQEELLWVCEAAQVPVVWATQVLDTFVRKGIHSRAEMTDAAMAERADCVMLNKGPFAAEAVRLLDDVLGRMEHHQAKKTSRLRALRSW